MKIWLKVPNLPRQVTSHKKNEHHSSKGFYNSSKALKPPHNTKLWKAQDLECYITAQLFLPFSTHVLRMWSCLISVTPH